MLEFFVRLLEIIVYSTESAWQTKHSQYAIFKEWSTNGSMQPWGGLVDAKGWTAFCDTVSEVHLAADDSGLQVTPVLVTYFNPAFRRADLHRSYVRPSARIQLYWSTKIILWACSFHANVCTCVLFFTMFASPKTPLVFCKQNICILDMWHLCCVVLCCVVLCCVVLCCVVLCCVVLCCVVWCGVVGWGGVEWGGVGCGAVRCGAVFNKHDANRRGTRQCSIASTGNCFFVLGDNNFATESTWYTIHRMISLPE